jgi:hypothetical protein
MKKFVIVFFIFIAAVACKDTSKKTENSVLKEAISQEIPSKTYRGEFIHTDKGAVLYGNQFIYGVVQNQKEKELAQQVAPVKRDSLDMIPVVVRGFVTKKKPNEEGWEDKLTITEIILVGSEPSTPDIKVESKKE